MYSAVYFPYTKLRDASLLRTALILWDHLEFIVPWNDFKLASVDNDVEVDEALELIGMAHFPSAEEQASAHAIIEELVTSTLPKDFLLEDSNMPPGGYLMYPTKFLPETWQMLKDAGLAIPSSQSFYEDWSMHKNIGLTVMSILADVCAGTEKRTITDQADSYKLLARSIGQVHGGSFGISSPTVERLIMIAAPMVDARQFTLRQLIDFRKRERKEGLTELRHNLLKTVDTFAKRIAAAQSSGDVNEIERQFRQEMQIDLNALQTDLWHNVVETVTSREVVLSVLALAGAAIGTSIPPLSISSGITGAVGLIHASNSYSKKRKELQKKHAMSFLVEASQQATHSPGHPAMTSSVR